MSRAFVKETDGEGVGEDLPDRPVSAHRNFVSATGLAQIDAALATLRDALATATAEGRKDQVAALARDLRYWSARRASAELVEPSAGEEVRFGATVTIERADGRRQSFRIVGEDEADPSAGTLSHVAPLARSLMGKVESDEVAFRDETIIVLGVS